MNLSIKNLKIVICRLYQECINFFMKMSDGEKSKLGSFFSKKEGDQESVNHDSQSPVNDLEKYIQEIESIKNQALLALAENENLRKRHSRELEENAKFATSSIMKELAVPFEHFFLAFKFEFPDHLKSDSTFKNFCNGIEMTKKEFEKVLSKNGLVRISPHGEKFDPNFHQAISKLKSEGAESGIVLDVIQAGYTLHGRVIKPAMVVVSE
jgi:molecular chaperone GrpE